MKKSSAQVALAGLPKRIKIGPHWWSIDVTRDKFDGDTDTAPTFGETYYDKLRISLKSNLSSPDIVVSTLLHELYHAGRFSLGFQSGALRKEENQALFAEALYTSVFKDNLWLLDWLKKWLKS